MENSLSKITWGYIWRVIVWYIVLSLVLITVVSIIIGASSVASMTNGNIDVNLAISISEKLLVAIIIVNIISIILACKLTTSKIKKKFAINSSNVKDVLKNIIIVLVVFAILNGIYSVITNAQKIDTQQEEIKQAISKASNLTEIKLIKDFDNFIKFCDVIRIVAIISNVGIILLMIPFEKKLLKVKDDNILNDVDKIEE